jgi:hypothetical protein
VDIQAAVSEPHTASQAQYNFFSSFPTQIVLQWKKLLHCKRFSIFVRIRVWTYASRARDVEARYEGTTPFRITKAVLQRSKERGLELTMDHLEIATLLETHQSQIANDVITATLQNPFWTERFGNRVNENVILDTNHNIETIARAIRYKSPMILNDYIVWLRKTLVSLRCSTGTVRETLVFLWRAITTHLPAESHSIIYQYIDSASQQLSYTNPAAKRLTDMHEKLAEDLTRQSYDTHWHWQTAYAHEGRSRVLYDSWLAVDFFLDALESTNDHVLVRHILWMRDQCLKRGLSTSHMQQFLWNLMGMVEHHLSSDMMAEVRHVLQMASASLLSYDNETVRALMAAQGAIVSEVAHQLVAQGIVNSPEHAAMEIGWYLAYLTDSLVTNESSNLIGYTRWMQQWFTSHGISQAVLHQIYAALNDALERHLSHHSHQARSIVRAAQSSL